MREHWLAAYVCVAAGACFSPSAPTGIPCGPGFTCPGDQTCDIISNECGTPSEALLWRDDTAADFGVAGAYVDEVTVEKQGFVGPAGFLAGGVRVTGYEGLLVPNATAQFDDIVANTPAGVGLQRDLNIRYEETNPPGLNLSSDDDITVVVEGEIELEAAGNWRFRLTANDRGFFEIESAPGSGTFQRLIDDVDTGTVQTFAVTTPGWYRIRGAFQDATNFFDYTLDYDPPNINGNGFLAIPVERMRVRASDLEGLIVDGFDNAFMMDHFQTVVSSESLASVTLDNPFGLPVGVAALSVRWNGQFLIDQAGDYTFRIDTVDGHRMWIDGVSVADNFTDDPELTVTAPVTLDAGWHDLVLDVAKDGGTTAGTVKVTIDSGPQFVGGWFPADHLRPISGRGARFVADRNPNVLAIPDGPATPPAPVTRSLTVELPASFSPLWVFAAIEIDHDLPSSVELICDPPGGGPITVAAFGSMTGTATNRLHYIPLQVGNAASTGWQFIATDNLTDALDGQISRVMVSMVYDGGIAPFPTTYRYQSAVRDLGDVVAFERFAWLLRQAPDPSAVVVRLRTCDSADACATETYTDVVNGEAPTVPVRRFAQYEVAFTGNGDLPTALDAIELRYFVRGAQ